MNKKTRGTFFTRRRTLRQMAGLLLTPLLLGVSAAHAAPWPERPIRMIVAAGAGSSVDVFARLVAERLTKRLGQPVVVDPRPGANGTIAAQIVATAKPDGYTLLYAGNSALVVAPLMNSNLSYDAEKDLVPVAPVVYVPLAIAVAANSSIQDLQELVTAAKENEVFFATPGAASLSRLIGEGINEKAGTKLVNIAYPSSPPAQTDLIGGQVPVLIDGLGGIAPHAKTGRMRLIAVSTANRFKGFPDAPSISEVIPGLATPAMNIVMAPAGTPSSVIDLLNREINAITADPVVAELFVPMGGESAQGSPTDTEAMLRDQRVSFRKLIEIANIKAQ
jgi:tripartite-type tricarboxylate transporter receptor subunit TctC